MEFNPLTYYPLMLWLSIRNFFVKPFFWFGPTLLCCKSNEHGWENSLTTGKLYYSERRDMVSYYLKNDKGELMEVPKQRMALIKKLKYDKNWYSK